MCNSKRLCENEECQTCFEKSFASHEKSQYWSETNGDVKPRQVFKGSSNKYWFDCDICGHKFENSLNHITGMNRWCPYCVNQKLCEKEDCKTCFENSFASHEKSKYWSEKNGDVKPRQVFKRSHIKYWFDCDNCGHEFNISLSNLTQHNQWCPYCSNPPQKLCEKEECQTCFNKSFALHQKSKYWSVKNGDIKPRQVFKSANTKYWFDCDCGHEFESSINEITGQHNTWCSYCSNPPQKLCEKEDCKTCFENSFASHEKSKYWSHKNCDVKPRQVFNGSHKKYWFNCNTCGHEFKSSLSNITRNKWCPICVNKTEKKIYEHLLQIYPNIISQFRADWCKNPITTRILPFDFVLEEQKVIIELDGPQHFVQVMNWKTPEEQFENDQYKKKYANENGYSIIRILQEDVWNDTYDWLNELTQNIIKITSENKIQNIYMCKNNEYNNFNS